MASLMLLLILLTTAHLQHMPNLSLETQHGILKVKALFVTVDVPVISKREVDERIRSSGAPDGGFVRRASSFIDLTLTWCDLAWLRSITDAPIVVKGIKRSADAILAMRYGCQGLVLSNHGGRAADTAALTILTLLELQKNCPEVFGAMEVLVDGGFRRGSDVVKATCLGASAVCLGRPFLHALGYGQEGIELAVQIIRDEVETAMHLCGMTDLMRDACPDYTNTASIDCLVPHQDAHMPGK
ncbi:hypothetical protein OIDMADRAFT_61574 [Oidiodendron maius Zn]|uniref:FMN hydroxy acid dehydrogenase domain-containing protein n=1 Tax=Oidiodendron maius (strain Zn) TaxID=913774 RepID=A0A0C3GPV3_OIDMZ|nr:hypothetical protein OIDMADRAFT_61574 [Oidiodendron maius Zn]